MADIAELGIKVDTKELSAATAKLAQFGKVAATAGVAAAAGIAAIVHRQMELIDQQSKMAKAIDTTYASLSNLKRAAELGGVGVDQLNMASKMLALNIGQAIAGTEAQAKAFQRLGIDAKELAKIPLDERILKINTALKENVSASERASVAADIYGAKNALLMKELDPDTLREGARQAKMFGQALSDIDAEKVEMAGDAISTFGAAADGMTKQLTLALTPAIYGVGSAFLEAAGNLGTMKDKAEFAAEAMVTSFGAVGDVVGALSRAFEITGSGLANVYLRAEKIDKQIDLFFVKLKGGSTRLSVQGLQADIENLDRAIEAANLDPQDILMDATFSEKMRALLDRAKKDLEEQAKSSAKAREEEKKSAAESENVAKAKLLAAEAAKRQSDEETYLAGVRAESIKIWQEKMDKEKEDIDSVRQMLATEEELIKSHYENQRKTVNEAITLAAEEKAALVIALQKKEDEELAKLAEKRREEQLSSNMAMLDGYENLFGALHGLSTAFGKEQSKTARVLFGISQALAVAKAMLSISAAAEALGDPAIKTEQRIAHAAVIASAVTGIVSSVKSVKMQGMAHDGIMSVPKTGTWLLEKGERVTTAETSAKLDQTLNAIASGQGKGSTKIINVIDPAMVGDYLATDAGEEAILNIMRRNQRDFE